MQQTTSPLRARKMSTGGNRSWSEEEEAYLLQTRMQKMPYKHIAAHLKKTELACRLHYHQLSHGSHRRKRTASVSSVASSSAGQSPNPNQYSLPSESEDYLGDASTRHSSPASYTTSPPTHSSPFIAFQPTFSHKPILPKPLPPSQQAPPPTLRIDTSSPVSHPKPVDIDRLRAIYESHRESFWAAIANAYGPGVSHSQLEAAWLQFVTQGSTVVRPPTPESSPDGSVLAHPVLKPPPFPSFGAAQSSQASTGGPSPERSAFVLPAPVPSASATGISPGGRLSRSSTWSSTSSIPATSISALLTEDKSPRPENDRMQM